MAAHLCRLLCVCVLWTLAVVLSNVLLAAAICQDTETDVPKLFATKTTYDYVRGTEVKEETVPGCDVIQHYIVNRHGTRYDDAEDIADARTIMHKLRDQVVLAHDQGKGELCSADLEALRRWTMRMQEENSMKLADEGWRELREHAQRTKQRFPELFRNGYSAADFLFRNTQALDGNRTRDSARAYALGLFDSFDKIYLKEYPIEVDKLLNFYKTCNKYIQTVDERPIVEQEKFQAGTEVQGVITAVTQRLGLEAGSLDWETIEVMFDTCGYDNGIYGDAPWISAFSREDLQIINYFEDLKYYWVDAYGHKINYEMPCELIADVVDHFESAMYTGKPKAVHRFGHSSTTNGMLAILGLYKDPEPLRHNNFSPENPKQWRASMISPMSASVEIALYQCDDGQFRIKSFVNEKPVVLPQCSSEVCLLEDAMLLWMPIAETCNVDQICRYPDVEDPDNKGIAVMSTAVFHFKLILFVCLVFSMMLA